MQDIDVEKWSSLKIIGLKENKLIILANMLWGRHIYVYDDDIKKSLIKIYVGVYKDIKCQIKDNHILIQAINYNSQINGGIEIIHSKNVSSTQSSHLLCGLNSNASYINEKTNSMIIYEYFSYCCKKINVKWDYLFLYDDMKTICMKRKYVNNNSMTVKFISENQITNEMNIWIRDINCKPIKPILTKKNETIFVSNNFKLIKIKVHDEYIESLDISEYFDNVSKYKIKLLKSDHDIDKFIFCMIEPYIMSSVNKSKILIVDTENMNIHLVINNLPSIHSIHAELFRKKIYIVPHNDEEKIIMINMGGRWGEN